LPIAVGESSIWPALVAHRRGASACGIDLRQDGKAPLNLEWYFRSH
jgi:hypothetical protein